ncbi:MAG: polysaccharide biosynthesis protein [Lachnospiraceae bacterium]|nr:polysaccharide biosynthesis protein [Lachnospiraceae bacterium]
MGRVQFAAKNIAFGWIGNIATLLLGAWLRQVFILRLGDTLLGVNDYYTSILTVLSLAELGIGTAFNYSLYGPVARNDYEKIKSYMLLYKKAYRVIACVIAVIGLAIVPFLRYLIKDPGSNTWEDLTVYYLIFLFNTVSTYFVAYKYSMVNAQQKNYIQTNAITITKIVTVTLQIAGLVIFPDFYLYLFTAAAAELLQKIIVSYYLNRLYPYLKDRSVERLSGEEVGRIASQTRALVLHKVGDMARLQTDTAIIGAFIDVTTVGFVGTYNYVVSSVSNFVNIIFNSVLSGFGNLIATEGKEKQYLMFRVYRFLACWIYGFSAIGFYCMLTPLIILWVGEERVLPDIVIGCIMIDYYFKGERIVLSNYKTAAGLFEQDKYLALIQGAVNLVISILLVQKVGLVGIYIGTILSGLIANVTKPVIIYRVCFGKRAGGYFLDSLKYLGVNTAALVLILLMKQAVMTRVSIFSFILMVILITAVFQALFFLAFGRCQEMKYILRLLGGKVRGRLWRAE